ncbi:type II toxin-antitoxin system RelE/ParE family toxin [Mesorhizobium sp. CN2-181]|uniref:type II toxin-antitoxin system RelE/ParE family toxin n=1 Tax=Mesorhizobium yinganensis TaxID=3157707 RepID=UPI0032B837B9
MRLVVSGTAREEIARIPDYIAQDSPRAALGMTAQLRERFREIKERPHANALLAGFEHRQIRRKVHRNHLIIYRMTDDRIGIVHVVHGAMDYQTILHEDGWLSVSRHLGRGRDLKPRR